MHVSKISLSYITKVYVHEKPETFVVTTAGGAYVLTANTAAESKSWVRSIQVRVFTETKETNLIGRHYE